MDKYVDISALKGEIFDKIQVVEGDEALYFFQKGEPRFKMCHEQDCCEDVYLDDVTGDLHDLLGSPITVAYETSSSDCGLQSGEDPEDSYTWTFYHIATSKGWVTLRWCGFSNGYYSESVDLYEVNPPESQG